MISSEIAKDHPARSAPPQMRPDLDKPKQLHSFLDGQLLPDMLKWTRINQNKSLAFFVKSC